MAESDIVQWAAIFAVKDCRGNKSCQTILKKALLSLIYNIGPLSPSVSAQNRRQSFVDIFTLLFAC